MYLAYWKYHNLLIDYLLIDYIITLGYNFIPYIKDMIDSLPYSNPKIHELVNLLNYEFDEEQYRNIIKNTTFHKLSYKISIDENNKNTFYNYIIKNDKN